MQEIYFISDLHLQTKAPEAAEGFIQFLRHQTHEAKALYILGDFFDAWLGDDLANDFEKNIIAELAKATQAGLPIYFIRGNRDFLIGKRFARETGIKILKDPSVVDIFGNSWLISHGDYLCTDDLGHMKLRKLTLNPIAQFIFLKLPISIRKKMRDTLRRKSRDHKKSQPMEIMDINSETLEKEMRHYHVTHMIHGHTHQGKICEFMLDKTKAIRVVLGDWHDSAKILRLNADGSFQLETLDLKSAKTATTA
jgi:UDP-2,3-diacylglucosamine hydrolase